MPESLDINPIISGNKRAIAKAIDKTENEENDCISLLESLYSNTGKAHRVGITGPPGAGKSTFANQLIKLFRSSGYTVGVIAVDPSSLFTGGAIFGDRLRMDDVASDPGVFIRSMGTRGSLGGLARQTAEVADILDASGKDVIIFETAGVGQIGMDIMSAADTIVVITVPEAGDIVQAMKAGPMEIGDIFVVNKADIPGADRMKSDIEMALNLGEKRSEWHCHVRKADSRKGIGIQEIFDDINYHFQYLKNKGILHLKRNRQIRNRVRGLVSDHITRKFWTNDILARLNEITNRDEPRISPYAVARELVEISEKR